MTRRNMGGKKGWQGEKDDGGVPGEYKKWKGRKNVFPGKADRRITASLKKDRGNISERESGLRKKRASGRSYGLKCRIGGCIGIQSKGRGNFPNGKKEV